MVEAMGRSLPCIGTIVGGIPELLPPEDMAPPGKTDSLARKIQEVLNSPARMAKMSAAISPKPPSIAATCWPPAAKPSSSACAGPPPNGSPDGPQQA
jgi:glycosyltransferase involved in cell wall biosynthesis